MDEFCVQECARYAQASADPMLDERQRADSWVWHKLPDIFVVGSVF